MNILSIIVFLPTFGALLCLFAPKRHVRTVAVLATLATFIVALLLFGTFLGGADGSSESVFGSSYGKLHHDVDGIDELPGVVDRKDPRLEDFVCVKGSRLSRCGQPGQPEEDHLFIAVARRRIEGPHTLDHIGHLARLFLALTPGRGLDIFVGFERPCRKLPDPPVDAVAILPYENDMRGVRHRNEDDRRPVANHVHGSFMTVG